MAGVRRAASGTLKEISSTTLYGLTKPFTGDRAGAITTLSMLKPNSVPCFSSTPTTWKGCPCTRMVLPTAPRPSNSLSATSLPITATGTPRAASCSANGRPWSSPSSRIWKYGADAPFTVTFSSVRPPGPCT